MYRTLVAALGLVVLACWVGMPHVPQAAAENPVCSTTWCAFLSPSRNIGCEMNYQRGSGIPDETYCQTDSPPQSVHMSTTGTIKTCTGATCLGNAGQGTPTLAYGLTAGLGPFNCRSEPSGVTCTVTGGRGFTISNAGVAPVG
jgi:hypothetical protein